MIPVTNVPSYVIGLRASRRRPKPEPQAPTSLFAFPALAAVAKRPLRVTTHRPTPTVDGPGICRDEPPPTPGCQSRSANGSSHGAPSIRSPGDAPRRQIARLCRMGRSGRTTRRPLPWPAGLAAPVSRCRRDRVARRPADHRGPTGLRPVRPAARSVVPHLGRRLCGAAQLARPAAVSHRRLVGRWSVRARVRRSDARARLVGGPGSQRRATRQGSRGAGRTAGGGAERGRALATRSSRRGREDDQAEPVVCGRSGFDLREVRPPGRCRSRAPGAARRARGDDPVLPRGGPARARQGS
jgi:hypothetical protein